MDSSVATVELLDAITFHLTGFRFSMPLILTERPTDIIVNISPLAHAAERKKMRLTELTHGALRSIFLEDRIPEIKQGQEV